jgi:precorrin-3B methylase
MLDNRLIGKKMKIAYLAEIKKRITTDMKSLIIVGKNNVNCTKSFLIMLNLNKNRIPYLIKY